MLFGVVMAKLIIARASGATVELELQPGVEIPPIRPGDEVRIVLPNGQSVRPQIAGNDVVIVLPAAAGQPAETLVFENLALYLGDEATQLAIVDEQSGAVAEFNSAAEILSGIDPAAGVDLAEAPSSDGSARFNTGLEDDSLDDDAEFDADPDGAETILQQVFGEDAVRGLAEFEFFEDEDEDDDDDRFEIEDEEDDDDDFAELDVDDVEVDDDDVTSGPDTGSDDDDDSGVTTDDDDDGDTDAPVTVAGQAIDGYIVGATVFRDADEDGVRDAGEVFTVTGANGEFTLTGGSGPLVLTGGTDVSTGQAFKGTLSAPAGSTVVTPLTTLMQSMIDAGLAADAARAEQLVEAALGLPSDIDLTSFDPVGGAVDGVDGAEEVLGAAIKLQNTAVQAASVLNGAGGADLNTGTDAVYNSLATQLATDPSGFELDDATLIETVINNASTDSSLGLDNTALAQVQQAASGAATVITAANTIVDNSVSGGSSGTTFLTEVAQVASVAQNDAADALQSALQAVQGTGNIPDLTTATTNYSGNALQTAVNNTTPGAIGRATIGTDGDDSITDDADPTVIDGGAGDDVIDGGGGNDRLIGGAGDDTLTGGAGSDVLSGGAGNDSFIVRAGEQVDTIEDFSTGDTLDMTDFVTSNNGQAVIALTQSGTDTLVQVGGVTQVVVSGKGPSDLWVANDGNITVNSAPVAVTTTVSGADEDQAFNGQLTATDVDADTTLTFAIVSQPTAGTITITNANTGAFTYNPGGALDSLGAGESSTLNFVYTVSDGNATAQRSATITVDGVNDAPVATATAAAASENTVLTAQLTATDADANDSVSFAIVTPPAKGTLSLNANGIYTFDPGSDFDSLAAGVTENVTFVYSVTDSVGASDTETLTITVTGTNDAPVVTSQTPTTSEDATVSGDLTTWVIDADNDSLTFALVTPPAQGTLSIASNGAYTFDPGTAFQGLDDGESSLQTFTYTVSDGTVVVQRTANIIVTGANDAPTGITTALSAAEDTVLNGTLQASDVDIEALSFAVVTAPSKGTLTLNSDGTFSFDPNGEFESLDSGKTEDVTFVYSVSDGTATTQQTVTVTVAGANDAPVPTTIAINATEDGTITSGNLAATDVDGETLTFGLVSQPAVGTLTVNTDGSYTYDPGSAFQDLRAGESVDLSFVYSVSDGTASVNRTATLTVSGANDAPTAFFLNTNYADGDVSNDDTITVDRVVQAGTVVGRVQNIVDVDAGDSHTVQLTDDADGRFELNATTGEIVVASGASFPADSYAITVQITDSAGASLAKTFTVDVNNVTNGNSADGYIQGATVFADADGDRTLDAGEALATTDVEGGFRVQGGSGDLVMVGGTDVSTNLAFDGILIAPSGSSVITPLTSLIATMVNDTNAANAAAAQTALAAALGITSSLSSALAGSGASSLLHFDPVEQSVNGVSGAIDVMGGGVKVQNTVDIMAAAITGASGGAVTTIAATQAVFSAMASAMSVGGSFAGLTNTTAIESILNAAATGAGLDSSQQSTVSNAATQVAQIVTDSNGNVDTVLADTSLTAT